MTLTNVLYQVENRVATITLNRPEHHNAMNVDLATDLHSAMLQADSDDEVRVIVLTGAGKSFCVGADISSIKSAAGSGPADTKNMAKLYWPLDASMRHDYQATHNYFPMIGKPIICMLNGAAAGLGLIYACFSDMRFAAEDVVLAAAFVRRGLAAEWGMAWLLPRLIGHANASDIILSGRKLQAPEAREMGLLNRVVPREELASVTYAYAHEIAQNCAPLSLRLQKRQLWESYFQTLGESNMMFKEYTKIVLTTEDVREAAASFIEKRLPDFKGR